MNDVFIREIVIVTVLAVATIITRFLPFVLFPAGKAVPRYIDHLGKVLPYATMGLLVIYCLKDISIFTAPHGVPELIAVAVVIALQWWKENSLLSIGAGTILYMILIQVVFI